MRNDSSTHLEKAIATLKIAACAHSKELYIHSQEPYIHSKVSFDTLQRALARLKRLSLYEDFLQYPSGKYHR